MKRWQAVALIGFLLFGIYTAPEGSADRAREYGGFVVEGFGSLAEFADSVFDGGTVAGSSVG